MTSLYSLLLAKFRGRLGCCDRDKIKRKTAEPVDAVCTINQSRVTSISLLADCDSTDLESRVLFAERFQLCDNYRVSGALEKLEHETILQDRASDR